jgi:hypothetical protein
VAGSGTGSAMTAVAAVPAIKETLPTAAAAAASAAAAILAALAFLSVAGAPRPFAVACRRGVRHVRSRRSNCPKKTSFRYNVKKVIDFPVPSWDVTYQTLHGRDNFILPENLVSDWVRENH